LPVNIMKSKGISVVSGSCGVCQRSQLASPNHANAKADQSLGSCCQNAELGAKARSCEDCGGVAEWLKAQKRAWRAS
jgi:hypothetical protein